MSSKLFSVPKQSEEIYSSIRCVYHKDSESLCLILDNNIRYTDLSKEIIINLIQFAQNINANLITLLISKSNRDYVKFIQGMLTVGFEYADIKSAKIEGKVYKILSMKMETLNKEMEEIEF